MNGWAVADPLYCAGCGLFLHITKPTNQYDTCPGGLGGGAVPQHRVFFLSTLLTLTEHYALLIAKEIILELLSGGGHNHGRS